MSNEPGWNAQQPGQHPQPQPQQSPQPPPPPQPPPHPPQPPPPQPPPPQPPPPQQHHQYQQPPGPTAQVGRLARNIAALLAYLFGWIGGLIIYFTQQDREVRFHAAQSIITFGGLAVLIVILSIANIGGSILVAGLVWLLFLLSIGLWIFLSVQGYQLKHTKLPVIGGIAERWVAK
ncbi:MAG: DUF4870 domain-containing protein [Pseudonocardiaceae bacterium]